jgi:D-glycero-D-manno-heptose 1,7-bisphosphate phosphatase
VTALSKALFLDRDGTILKEITGDDPDKPASKGYLTKTDEVELIDGAADAIVKARKLGFKIIIITNQSAIARGWLSEDELEKINNRMYGLLKAASSEAIIDDLYYSPFHSEGIIEKYKQDSPLPTRKPGTGMVSKAVEEHNISITDSYMIGDAYSDIKTGENAGMKRILVMTGYGKIAYRKCLDEKLKIDFIADNLLNAVEFIEKNEKIQL